MWRMRTAIAGRSGGVSIYVRHALTPRPFILPLRSPRSPPGGELTANRCSDRDFDIGAHGHDSFPNMSTITYLTTSEVAMPTLIFTGLTMGDSFDSSPVERLWVVYPAAGKHVRFDGTLWHGVPPAAIFAPGATAARRVGRAHERRVTLLVNLWLNV